MVTARKLVFIVKKDWIQKQRNVTRSVTIGSVRDRIIISLDDCVLKQTRGNMHIPDIPQIEVQQSIPIIKIKLFHFHYFLINV